MKLSALVVFAILLGTSAWAEEHGAHGAGPCKPVHEACEAAGKKGKDAWECVKTIKGGGTVPGVTVTASAECKAAKGK